jgi:hypothetical protein
MRLAASFGVVILSCSAFAQSGPETESNMSCVERVRMPIYPKLADAARLSGTVKATVPLKSDGSIRQPIIMDTGTASGTAKRLFTSAVQEALLRSLFGKTCGGKSVS